MKRSLVKIEPLALRSADAADFIGISTDIVERAKAAKWITPEIDLRGVVSYSPASLRLLFERMKREGLPPRPPRPPKTPRQSLV